MSYLFKSCSSKSLGDHSLEDGEFIEKGETLVKWKMPKVPIHKMFEERRRKVFSFRSDPSIRTTESKFSFGKGGGYFRLYDQIPSFSYFRKGKHYNTMNVGLVQIGVKTLTRKVPSNASIIVCLRDNRVAQLHDSLLGLVESKLSDGPFYFNLFPNTNLPLTSSFVVNNVLSVHVFVKGFDELPKGSEPILLTCRTCYKFNPNNFGEEALLESPVGKTLFFQTRVLQDDVVQKLTIWDQLQLPSDWPPQLQINKLRMVFGSNGIVTTSTTDA